MQKTYYLKEKEVQKNWVLIDATNIVLGRLATIVAKILRGKHRPTFSPGMDCGDHVVIINSDKVALTGNKLDNLNGKKYYWHTGHPGGIKEVMARTLMKEKSTEVVTKAIERMITTNKLGRKIMKHLYVYPDANHKHQPQQPVVMDLASLNRKNVNI